MTCNRCADVATVTLLNNEPLCRPCAAAVIKDSAYSGALQRGMSFQQAYDFGVRAGEEFLKLTQESELV